MIENVSDFTKYLISLISHFYCNIYTFSGALSPDRILPGAKFTSRPSLAFA